MIIFNMFWGMTRVKVKKIGPNIGPKHSTKILSTFC